MPHLEFSTYAGQLFWLAISFILLYGLLWLAVLPRISGVLESRGNVIADDLEKAEKATNEAEGINVKFDRLLADSGEKARQIIDESTLRAKTAVEKKRAELSAKLDEKLARAERQVERIENESMAAVEKMTGELAELIVKKLTKAEAA